MAQQDSQTQMPAPTEDQKQEAFERLEAEDSEAKVDPFDELFKEWEQEEKEAEEKRRQELIAKGIDPDSDEAQQQADGVDEMVSDADVVDDAEFAFSLKEYEWSIPTGRYNEAGRPVNVRVKVVDPGDSDLPMKFIFALQKDAAKAEEALWRACVKSPKKLTEPGAVAKTTSVFRSTLTNRLRLLIGINRDFLESLAEMMGGGQTEPQRGKKSSAKSEQPSDSTPPTSPNASTGAGSTTPTGGPTSGASPSAPTSSPTSPSSSPRSLPQSPKTSSTPTSPKSLDLDAAPSS